LVNALKVGAVSLNDPLTEQLNIPPFNNGTAGETRDEADRLVRLGGQQERQGQLSKAIDSWWQAIALYHSIGDVKAQGLTYDFLGLTYAQLGRFTEAEDALRRRLAIARDNQDLQGHFWPK
jgi:tetratricopeptide (TPR) repeat protein